MRSIYLAAILCFSTVSNAEFQPWEDYQASDAVYYVSTIKVAANMGDIYLEGLANTWVTGNEVFKKSGQLEDYWIYRSDFPQSGDFNLMLIVKFADTKDLVPNKEKHQAFIKEFTKAKLAETSEYAQKNSPGIREITGDYLFREIKLK
ncbi:MAG: hypothetical protein ACJATO_000451 [Arenicella sp.]|jgi:hypothetical protein